MEIAAVAVALKKVLHDMLGIYDDRRPLKHAKRYAVLGETIRDAVRTYVSEVEGQQFPGKEHSFEMDEATMTELAAV